MTENGDGGRAGRSRNTGRVERLFIRPALQKGPTAMSMSDAVARTVDAVSPEDEDLLAGSIALAQLYARHIDQAAAIRAQADKTLRRAEQEGNETLIELVDSLRAKVSEVGVAVAIGKQLHALLAELQATPKTRKAAPPAEPAAPNALTLLRGGA